MAERENVIDFTVPYYDLVGISILMKKPSVSTSLFKFLTVLENDVWGCILGAYFFTRSDYLYLGSLLVVDVVPMPSESSTKDEPFVNGIQCHNHTRIRSL